VRLARKVIKDSGSDSGDSRLGGSVSVGSGWCVGKSLELATLEVNSSGECRRSVAKTCIAIEGLEEEVVEDWLDSDALMSVRTGSLTTLGRRCMLLLRHGWWPRFALRHGRVSWDSDFNAGRPDGLTVGEWRRVDYNGIAVLLTVKGKCGGR
jgi:hypothetical protein